MGTGLICAGFILLCNPVINVIDVIPDAIGFLLIFAGLTRLSFFYDRIERARRLFLWLAVAETAKIASIPLVVKASKFESGSMMVMLSLVFMIVELVLFLPAVVSMFEGYSAVAVKLGSDRSNAAVSKNGKVRDVSTRARNTMIVFMIIRCLSTLLPELTELELYESQGAVSAFSRPLTDFKMMFYRLFVIVVLIAAVFYIIALVRFFTGVARDEKMNAAFAEQYRVAKAENKSFFMAHRMKTALLFFALSTVALIPIYVDNVNITVGVLSAVLLVVSVIIMKRDTKGALRVIPIISVSGIVSIISFLLQIRFFDEYSTDAIEFVEEAARNYRFLSVVGAVDSALAAVAVVWFISVLLASVPDQQKISGIIADNIQYSKEARDREVFSYIKRKMITSVCLTVLALVSRALYRFIAPSAPAFIVVSVALALLAAAYTAVSVASVNTAFYDNEK